MKSAEDYRFVITEDGQSALVIPAFVGEPTTPYIWYKNGQSSALLYRTASDIVVLDKLHEKAAKVLSDIDKIVVIEADYRDYSTVYDYIAKVVHI